MEITSLSNVQQTSLIQKSQTKLGVEKLEQKDEIAFSEGMQEAEKMRQWVEMLKEMSDSPPAHFDRGSEASDVLLEVSMRLTEEVASFLTERP